MISNKYFDTNGDGDVGIAVDSVDILMFSLYPDRVLLEGDIMMNISFSRLVDCSLLFEDQSLVESCCNLLIIDFFFFLTVLRVPMACS